MKNRAVGSPMATVGTLGHSLNPRIILPSWKKFGKISIGRSGLYLGIPAVKDRVGIGVVTEIETESQGEDCPLLSLMHVSLRVVL